jgi:hypothetical protein
MCSNDIYFSGLGGASESLLVVSIERGGVPAVLAGCKTYAVTAETGVPLLAVLAGGKGVSPLFSDPVRGVDRELAALDGRIEVLAAFEAGAEALELIDASDIVRFRSWVPSVSATELSDPGVCGSSISSSKYLMFLLLSEGRDPGKVCSFRAFTH